MVAELLPGVDVGQMHLHAGQADGGDGVPQSHAGVGVGGGVEHHPVTPGAGVVEGVHQSAFVVGLEEFQLHPQLPSFLQQPAVDGFQGVLPVNSLFPDAQKIQVGAVDHHDFFHRCHSFDGRSTSPPRAAAMAFMAAASSVWVPADSQMMVGWQPRSTISWATGSKSGP